MDDPPPSLFLIRDSACRQTWLRATRSNSFLSFAIATVSKHRVQLQAGEASGSWNIGIH